MNLIKLDAIDSTNDFLKNLAGKQSLENFTTVCASNQTNGRGQMGSKWTSEEGKNLTMSVYLKEISILNSEIFLLNCIVSLAVFNTLKKYEITNLAIKWPNDIMSDQKKIGGILIENNINFKQKITSVVGIGINVNQTDFRFLPKASSMALVKNATFEIDKLTMELVESIQFYVNLFENNNLELLNRYNEIIFRKGIPTAFQDNSGKQFMGIIHGVEINGKLTLETSNKTIQYFDLKEIQMLY
jgi:BirA family biotin operon repressor/biotin-[acetyl-CoA-carboxylase] ligase